MTLKKNIAISKCSKNVQMFDGDCKTQTVSNWHV